MVLLAEEAFDRCAVVHDSDDDVSVVGRLLFLNDHVVSVVNANLHHGVSMHGQEERCRISHDVHRQRQAFRDVLFSQDGLSSGNVADKRD